MMDLFEYGHQRLHDDDNRPDWKSEMAKIYLRWLKAPERKKERLEIELMKAYSPFLVWKSFQYRNPMVGFTHRDAFDAGMERFHYSLGKFDLAKSPKGASALSSFLMIASTRDMYRARRWHEKLDDYGVLSLDGFYYDNDNGSSDTLEEFLCVGDDTRDDLEVESLFDAVDKVIDKMRPVDRAIACMRIGGVPMSEIQKELPLIGIAKMSRKDLQAAWRERILPELKAAVSRAGYGNGDDN